MAFLNVNLSDVQEAKPAGNGSYELMITGAQSTETGENSKHPGTPMIKFTLGFTDNELNAPTFNHYMTFPFEGEDNPHFKLLNIKRFLTQFNIPFNSEGLDTEAIAFEAIGKTSIAEVTLTEPNDKGDVYNQLKLARLPSESTGGGRGKPPGRRGRGE